MDREKFMEARERVLSGKRSAKGIGILGEKTLHAVLKEYYSHSGGEQEVALASYVADVVGEDGIIEIQTRAFEKLRRKLECFLAAARVTVVYPVAHHKWLQWVDEETGELSKRRKSPKTGTPYDAFYELYKIKHLLLHPSLSIHILLVDLEEQRLLNGWSTDRKRGASRYERIPLELCSEVVLSCPTDYLQLIPESLQEPFISADYKKASGLSASAACTALNVLYAVGAVQRTGKKGNSFLYIRSRAPCVQPENR